MTKVAVRSVLGDTRTAAIQLGGGFPWYTCPFCGSGVYLGDAPADWPGHALHGRCDNPGCPANPAMPLDAARVARGEAMLRDDQEAERKHNHEAARRRITEQNEARRKLYAEIGRMAREVGGCLTCALHELRTHGTMRIDAQMRPRFIRHRSPCPRERKIS